MKMRRAARKALAVPLMIGGAVLFLTIGTANVFAASSSVPVTSSGPHEHEYVVCSPNPIAAGQPCTITFTDAIHKGEPFSPHKVCFSVNPTSAGTVSACTHETQVRLERHRDRDVHLERQLLRQPAQQLGDHHRHRAQRKQPEAPHHGHDCSAPLPRTQVPSFQRAHSSPPGIGWLLAGIGLGAALVAVYALRIRRWLAPRRLAARQPE